MNLHTICHVGHTGTMDDGERVMETTLWMLANGYEPPNDPDYVELNQGRDFLAEDKKYDVVLLHFLFRVGLGEHLGLNATKGLSTSTLASWSSWRRRLVATEAKLVFAYGGIAEVGGTYLCDLPGYRIHQLRTEDLMAIDRRIAHEGLWVFEKILAGA